MNTFVNFWPDFAANVAYQEFDIPEDFPLPLRQFIPNVHLKGENSDTSPHQDRSLRFQYCKRVYQGLNTKANLTALTTNNFETGFALECIAVIFSKNLFFFMQLIFGGLDGLTTSIFYK